MRHHALYIAISVLALGLTTVSTSADAAEPTKSEKKVKTGHKFKGNVSGQVRSNSNISVAPASGGGFDFADASDFDDDDEEEIDDEDEEDDFDDDSDDIIDADFDEDEIDEDGAFDEDGDGIDDLIDPDDNDAVIDSLERFSTKLGVGHQYKFANGTTSWNNGAKIGLDKHQEKSELDKINWAVTSGFEFSPLKSKHSYKTSLSFVTLEKDDNNFAETVVASIGYGYKLTQRVNLTATYNYQSKNIVNPKSPDSRVDTLAFGIDYKITSDDILRIKLAPKFEDSTKTTRDSDAAAWEVAYTRKLPWELALGLGYKFDSVDYVNLEPRRKDDNKTYAIQLAKEVVKSITAEVGFERRKRISSIATKDAENKSMYFNLNWKF